MILLNNISPKAFAQSNRFAIPSSEICLIACFLITFLSIFASFYYSYAVLIGFLCCLYYVSVSKPEESAFIVILLFPEATLFKLLPIETSFLTIIQLVWTFKVFFQKTDMILSFLFILLPFSLCFSLIEFHSEYNGLFDLLKIFLNFAFAYCYITIFHSQDIFKKFCYYYFLGLIFSIIMGEFKLVIPGMTERYADLNYEYVDTGIVVNRYSASFLDPNFFSLSIFMALSLYLILMYYNINTPFFDFSSLLFFITGFRTYSKSYLLTVCPLLMIYFFLLLYKKKVFIISVISLIVLLLFDTIINNEILSMGINRFYYDSDLTTGRNDIWASYYSNISSDIYTLLLGHGFKLEYLNDQAQHNTYIELLYHGGIIGLFAFFAIFLLIIFHNHTRKRPFVTYLPLLFLLVTIFFLSTIRTFEFPIYIITCGIALNSNYLFFSKKDISASDCTV